METLGLLYLGTFGSEVDLAKSVHWYESAKRYSDDAQLASNLSGVVAHRMVESNPDMRAARAAQQGQLARIGG